MTATRVLGSRPGPTGPTVAGLIEPRRQAEAGYLAVQAGLAVLWWIGLARLPALRAPFELDPGHPAVLVAWFPADLAVFVAGSALAAYGLRGSRRWTAGVVAATAGGTAYATLRLAGWVAAGGAGGWGMVPMAAATAVTGLIAIDLQRGDLQRGER